MSRVLLLLTIAVHESPAQEVPVNYINEALSSNMVLKQKSISLNKSLLAVKEAKSLFMPTTWFEGSYTIAKGGRSIDIPVGDLMNPVYRTLNQLTGSDKFPQIGNVSEQLNPNNFYDFRIRTTMPVYNPDLSINRTLQEQRSELSQIEVDIYRRTLVREVKVAYYNYLLAGKAIAIYENALELVNQNLRMNLSLVKNGRGLQAYVSRAEAEITLVLSQLQNARNNLQNAQAAFNFLLNKSFTEPIINNDQGDTVAIQLPQEPDADISRREELKSLTLSKAIHANQLRISKAFRQPRLNAFLDLASQGYNMNFDRKTLYYLGGLQLQVPIFSGGRNLYKIKQNSFDARAVEYNSINTIQQLELAAIVSRNNLKTSRDIYLSSLKQQEAVKQYFKLINRGYAEGVNSFIEFIDARNQVTTSMLQVVINRYKMLIAIADFEQQTASYSLK